MLYEAVKKDLIKYGKHGNQKKILSDFKLKYLPRTCEYKLNEEYSIIFLSNMDKKLGWCNMLTNDGLYLYETNTLLDKNWINYNKRCKKRITFMKDTQSIYGQEYAFIGIFKLDMSYDYTKEFYKNGKSLEPTIRYKLITNICNTNDYL